MDFVALSFWQMKQQKAQFKKDVSTLIPLCILQSALSLVDQV